MYLDIYAIQNVPPSNMNRDDTGSPKTAMYGGALRARVSSQAWKRAMRTMFVELLPQEKLGVRTKLAVGLLASAITEKDPELADTATDLAAAVFKAAGIDVKKSKRQGSDNEADETGYLIFIARRELEGLAGIAIAWAQEGVDPKKVDKARKKEVAAVFRGSQAVDIALFGRMLAEAPELNTDAAAQVAHAISVDRITPEYDYFTAVDDCAAEDNAGAGMIGAVDFNSSTLYRYATVNVDALLRQLDDAEATACGCEVFVDAFVRSMPTGKQNTFANRTLPSTVCVALREQQPINAVGAFETPVRPSEEFSVSQRAACLLAETLKGIEDGYGQPAAAKWYTGVGLPAVDLAGLGESVTFGELLSAVKGQVMAYVSGGGER